MSGATIVRVPAGPIAAQVLRRLVDALAERAGLAPHHLDDALRAAGVLALEAPAADHLSVHLTSRRQALEMLAGPLAPGSAERLARESPGAALSPQSPPPEGGPGVGEYLRVVIPAV